MQILKEEELAEKIKKTVKMSKDDERMSKDTNKMSKDDFETSKVDENMSEKMSELNNPLKMSEKLNQLITIKSFYLSSV